MQTSLSFQVLSAPLSEKVLLAFRKNAGWDNRDTSALGAIGQWGGQARWVTVESGKKRVAIARLELAPPQFCFVSDLIVLREHRGRGVGEWLMQQIERHCIDLRIPRVLLQPMADNRAFYEKLDFVADPLVAGFLKKDIRPLQRRLLPF